MGYSVFEGSRSTAAPLSHYILLLLLLAGVFPLHAQNVLAFGPRTPPGQQQPADAAQARISLKMRNEKLQHVLQRLEKMISYAFVYSPDDINAAQRISVEVKDADINQVMTIISRQIGAEFELINDKIILRNKASQDRAEGSVPLQLQNAFALQGQIIADADIIISGRVTGEGGVPVSGASVLLKGTTIGTTTDAQGNYALSIPDNQAEGTLVFSYVGYQPIEAPINNQRQVSIALTATQRDLDEVVVVGYGTQRRSSVTGSVDKVGSKAISGRPVTNLTTALQGTSPNLIIQQRNFEPGQPVNLNIRGLGTLNDNSPLVVIDGIIGGDINLINPADIESVSVLKDAGTAAIYGSRSANGVLLITTKKGRKNEKPSVAYSAIYGKQVPRITYTPVDAWENAYYKNQSLANSGQQPLFSPADLREFRERGNGDWRIDNILRNAAQQSHNFTVSGGSSNSTYLFSAGYLNQQNNFIGDYGYQRYNIRFNQSMEFGRFKLSTILSYVKTRNRDHSSTSGTLMVDAGRVPLYYSFQDTLGNYLTNPVSAQFNPKGVLERGGYRQSNDDEVFGSFTGELSITRGLKLRGVFGGTVRSNTTFGRRLQINFVPASIYGQDREVFDNNSKSLLTNLQLLAEYERTFGVHSIKVLAGGTNESLDSRGSGLTKTLLDSALGVPTTGTIISTGSFNSNLSTLETSLNSLLGRINYDYDKKYFVEFSARLDASSKFAPGYRNAFFPSVAIAWNPLEESFLEGLRSRVNTLKLRASYGILGNQSVGGYQWQTTFFNYTNAYGFNNSAVGGAGFSLANPDISWESAATYNVGVDAEFFKRRLSASVDYFHKYTKDILIPREDVPAIFGAGFPAFNAAEVLNRGWELKLNYTLPGNAFNQTIGINLADNLNELKQYTFSADELVTRKEEFEFVRREGFPITMYQGYKRNGYFQNLDDLKGAAIFNGQNRDALSPGDIKFTDRNGDGVLDDTDKFILGNPFPRYTFGVNYTANFKGFDLSLFIQGVGKRDAMIRGELVEPFHFGYGGTMYVHQTDYWTPTNPDAKWPRLAEAGSASNTNNYRTGSDVYLFDAAYARLKNVQIGYSLPAALLNRVKIQRARIYLTGQNLFTLTKLDFIDPEITEFDTNTGFGTGANSARAYPLPQFYGVGLDVNF